MNYANQKEIYLDKKRIASLYNDENSNEQFLHSLSWNEILPVLQELNGNEFKIWLYILKWTGKDSFFFSPAALIQEFNISESTAQRGFKRLEELKYLRKNPIKKGYDFYPQGSRS